MTATPNADDPRAQAIIAEARQANTDAYAAFMNRKAGTPGATVDAVDDAVARWEAARAELADYLGITEGAAHELIVGV